MKKYLSVFMILLLALMLTTACGTTSTNTATDEDTANKNEDMTFVAAGEWEHRSMNEDNSEMLITLNLEDSGDFELTVANEGTVEGSPEQTDAVVKGTYTAMDDMLELKIAEVDGDTALLGENVKADETVEQPYVVENEYNILTLTKAKDLVPTMADSLVFDRVN